MEFNKHYLEEYLTKTTRGDIVNWEAIVNLRAKRNSKKFYNSLLEELASKGILCYENQEDSYFVTDGSINISILNYDNNTHYHFSRSTDAEEWAKIQYKDSKDKTRLLNKVIKKIEIE